jgi:lactate dehydrogenase-like 2-hydroxyacid dehydrogenase
VSVESKLSKPDVLVVAKLWPYLMARLQAEFTVHDRTHESDPAAFAAIAPKIRAISGGGESKVNAALIASLPALEMVSVFGVGYDGYDVPALRARGVPLTNTPDVLSDDVADMGIMLMLAVARRLPQNDVYLRSGQWLNGPAPLSRKVSGARLGIVGLGRIGMAIARRAEGFGMSIAYTTRTPRKDVPYQHFASAAALASEVDFLMVITPGGAGTKGLINAEVLAALGKDGYLINVARGSVVDEAALVKALDDGVIAGAGLDVFEKEPNVPQALIARDNVVLSPHAASATWQTRTAMSDLAFGNLKAHFSGQTLLTPVS